MIEAFTSGAKAAFASELLNIETVKRARTALMALQPLRIVNTLYLSLSQ